MGMILFYCGVALLAATVITALVFRAKPLRYMPPGAEDQENAVPGPAGGTAQGTVPMGADAGRTVPMGPAAGMAVPMDQGVTVPMGQPDATVPMDRS